MKAKLGSEAGMQCKPNEFLLQLNAEWSKPHNMNRVMTNINKF